LRFGGDIPSRPVKRRGSAPKRSLVNRCLWWWGGAGAPDAHAPFVQPGTLSDRVSGYGNHALVAEEFVKCWVREDFRHGHRLAVDLHVQRGEANAMAVVHPLVRVAAIERLDRRSGLVVPAVDEDLAR